MKTLYDICIKEEERKEAGIKNIDRLYVDPLIRFYIPRTAEELHKRLLLLLEKEESNNTKETEK